MAWLDEEKSGIFHVCFRYGGRRFKTSAKTREGTKAERLQARIEENLELVNRGRIKLPDDGDLVTFLSSDGRLARNQTCATQLLLGNLFDAYAEALPRDSHAPESLRIAKIHMGHISRLIGSRTSLSTVKTADIQRFISLRSNEIGRRGKPISTGTIRKEVATFRTLWRWARSFGHVKAEFPNQGVKYPLSSEAPPFLTWSEIERRIQKGLANGSAAELWDCLYLSTKEIDLFLDFIQEHTRYGFLYPMCVMAAHTGARRSELCRSRLEDIDFEGDTLVIREKKRVRGRDSFRHVPLSPRLKQALDAWCSATGASDFTFPADHRVKRQRNAARRENDFSVSPDEATDHLSCCIASSRWKRIKGWHVFRHSFISNCASLGVDQRMIDAWVGHQTDAMRRRYRHLFPNKQQDAMLRVFG